MALRYRRSIDGDALSGGKDYTLDSTYASTALKGDAVKLNASGNVVLAAPADTAILGVINGFNFNGIGNLPTIAKVTLDPEALYAADTTGTGTFVPGDSFKLATSGNQLDLTTKNAAGTQFKVAEVVGGVPYVVNIVRALV